LQLTTHLSIPKGSGWLTYSRWFTHISGHMSAVGGAQNKESLYSVFPAHYAIPALPRKRSPDGTTTDCCGRHLTAAYYCLLYGRHLSGNCEKLDPVWKRGQGN